MAQTISKPITEKQEKKIRADFRRGMAFADSERGKRVGQEILKHTREFNNKKREASLKRTQDLAKDTAHTLSMMSRGRISVSGDLPLECLTCKFRIGHLDICLPCKDFSNHQSKGE